MTPQERAVSESLHELGRKPEELPQLIEKAAAIAGRKPRADKGVPRPKPSPTPGVQGTITREQVNKLRELYAEAHQAWIDASDGERRYNDASMALELFIESLVQP